MKYALVYDLNGQDEIFGYTECLDARQLAQLCENAIFDGIDIFHIIVTGRRTA